MDKWQLANVFVVMILSLGLVQALEISPEVELVSLYNSTAFIQRVQSLNTAEKELSLFIPNQADPDTLLVIDSGAQILQLSVVSQSTREALKGVKVQMLEANIGKEVQLVTEKFSVKGTLKRMVWGKYLVLSNPVLYNGSLNIPAANDFVLSIDEVTSLSLSVVPEIAELEGEEGVLEKKVLSISENILRQQRNLEVKYFVSQAGWNPVYQLFLESKEKAKLIYYAKAFNNTEEDWENIKLEIIAGNPNLKSPVYRDYDYAVKRLMEESDLMGAMPVPMAAGEQFVSGEAEQLHSYGLKRFISIKKKSNNFIPILSETVPIEKEYRWKAEWKETVDYYLTLINSTEEPLADGWLSVYSGSSYVGGNYLPWTQTDANNSIFISKAPDIKVKKAVDRTVSKTPGMTVTRHSAVLSLENHKKEEAKVRVSDYLPSDAELFTSNTPHTAKDGKVEWIVTLKAGQKYDITYSYRQTHHERGYPVPLPAG